MTAGLRAKLTSRLLTALFPITRRLAMVGASRVVARLSSSTRRYQVTELIVRVQRLIVTRILATEVALPTRVFSGSSTVEYLAIMRLLMAAAFITIIKFPQYQLLAAARSLTIQRAGGAAAFLFVKGISHLIRQRFPKIR